MKTITTIFCFAACSAWLFSQTRPAVPLAQATGQAPFEKLYLHTDHSLYQPGEVVWFRAYLVGSGKQCEGTSHAIAVELTDPQGNLVASCNLSCADGTLDNGLQLPSGTGGIFTLRAYTDWMGNFGPDAVFEKKLTVQKTVKPRLRLRLETERNQYRPGERVLAKLEAASIDNKPISHRSCQVTANFAGRPVLQLAVKTDQQGKASFAFVLPNELPPGNGLLQVTVTHEGAMESVARPIPVANRQLEVQFFPEGGDLALGWRNWVAFEATDTVGNPVDVHGVLLDQTGDTVLAEVASFHKGMGAFWLEPMPGRQYFLNLEGQAKPFPLPQALPKELGLSLSEGWWTADSPMNLPASHEVFGQVGGVIHAAQPATVWLVLRMADRLVFEQKISLLPGENRFSIPVDTLPAGIVQVTVFDEKLRPHCERLAFVNPQRQVQLAISTQKKQYLPGEQVVVDIKAQDEAGRPISGMFSAAVVEDRLWTLADDKQDHIVSRMLLTSELRGQVDEPSFYFDRSQAKAPQALDLVLLTHGWRRFQWKDFLGKTEAELAALPKLQPPSVPITGYAYFRGDLMKRKGTKVSIVGTDRATTTDDRGMFSINAAGLSFPLKLEVRHKWYAEQFDVARPSSLQQRLAPRKKETKPLIFNEKELLELGSEVVVEAVASPAPQPSIEVLEGEIAGVAISRKELLSEVVVVGYSSSLQQDKTSAISSVRSTPSQTDAMPGLGDNLLFNNQFQAAAFGPYFYQTFDHSYHHRRTFYQPHQRAGVASQSGTIKTVFWQPTVQVVNGKGSFQFYNTLEVSTFRIVAEGLGETGQVGRAELTFFTEKPVSMEVRLPAVVSFGDTLVAELTVSNKTATEQAVSLDFDLPESLHLASGTNLPGSAVLPPRSVKKYQVPLAVGNRPGRAQVRFHLKSATTGTDAVAQEIQVVPKGFARQVYASGNEAEKTLRFEVDKVLGGTLEASFTAYPHFIGEISDGLASMVREPHGCFEQVSSSNYPNIMALQVLNHTGIPDFDFQKQAKVFLEKGYQKLAGYECSGGGFSLYGHNPPDQRLTTYGLLQFWDMQEVYDGVSPKLLKRTLNWLLDQQDKITGLFSKDPLTHAFTLYVLSELGRAARPGSALAFDPAVVKESLADLDHTASTTDDPYLLSVVACANLRAGRNEAADGQVQRLLGLLKKQGAGDFKVKQTFSISYGKSMQVETAAWAALALSEAGQLEAPELLGLLDFLQRSRSGYGGFGSTQATVVTLKAFKSYFFKKRKQSAAGRLIVEVNGHADTLAYTEDTYYRLRVDLSPWFVDGENYVRIRQESTLRGKKGDLDHFMLPEKWFLASAPIPYVVQANWRTAKIPAPDDSLPLALETKLSATTVRTGDFVQCEVALSNTAHAEVYAPMAVIGIPAGLGLQGWQLQELAKQRAFEFFEVRDNYLVAYYERLAAGEVRRFQLDLKADVAGQYEAPASVAYPYYNDEQKFWEYGEAVRIGE